MSQLEVSKYQLYSAPITLVAGVLAPVATANFNGSSRVLSIVRSALGVAPVGTPHTSIATPTGVAGNAVWKLGMYSSVNTDDATYTVYWYNTYDASPSYLQAGAGVGVQFAP
jgi:hypothetical protein